MMHSDKKCHSSQILQREEGNPIQQKSRIVGQVGMEQWPLQAVRGQVF